MANLPANINPPLTAAERAARSVFVGNIPYEATEEALKDIFAQVGPVVSFRLVYDRETGKPKGYGFCEYQDIETGHSAMRNLNNYDFGGRPLRVGVAAGEQNKDEMKGMQQAVGGQVIESPYGDSVEPEKVPEAISKAVASLPPEQMYELMKQMKLCIQNNPNEARNMLLQNPQLAYALLQAQIVMKIVDPQVALAMLYRQSEQIPPLLPDSSNAGPSAPSSSKPVDAPRQSPMANPGASPAGYQSPAQPKPPASAAPSVPSLLSLPVGASAPAGGAPGQPPMPGRPGDFGPGPGVPMHGRPPGGPGMMPDDRMADGRMGGPPRGGPGGMYDRGPGGGDMGPGGPRHMGPGGPPMGPPGGRPDMHDPRGRPDPRDPRQMDMGMDPRGRGGMDPRATGIDPRAASRDVDHRVMDPRGGHRGPPGAMPPPPHQPPMHGGPPRAAAPPPPPPPQSAAAAATAASAVAGQDQEKAALIMQVLQLSDQQISMLPPDQRQSILILKEQIARSGGAP